MTSIHKEIEVHCEAASAWDAIRDVGSIHKRLVPGFVVDCRLDGDVRTVRFANGMVAREAILSVDDARYRHAWAATGAGLTHYNASLQVFPEGARRCRLVWIADFTPHEAAGSIEGMIGQGLTVMKKTLEKRS